MKMLVNGKQTDAMDGGVIEVTDPYTLEVIDTVPAATKEDVRSAIRYAQTGKRSFGRLSMYQRAEYLKKAAKSITEHVEELAALLTREMGKPITQSRAEIQTAAKLFLGFTEKALHLSDSVLPRGVNPGEDESLYFTKREPLGVVACVLPFNFPVELFAHKVAPALLMGNSVLVKPASEAPLAVLRTAELLLECGIPGDVLQVITGSGARIGTLMSTSPDINAISLTGSTEVGIDIAVNAASNLTRTYLELGGNDAMLIFADADLDLAASEAAFGRTINAGQVCCGTKRFLVERQVADIFAQKLKDLLQSKVLGDPFSESTDIGPLVSVKAAKAAQEQVNEMLSLGAKCLCGGKRVQESFYLPTVLTDISSQMPIARDMEIFAPVCPILPFDTVKEAVAIANQSQYGLMAGIMTRDISRALTIADHLEAGGVGINSCSTCRTVDMAFGGYKKSGIGREGIEYTLEEMSQIKTIGLKNLIRKEL
ncbi:aldehyde dehydrogenase family protein [Diplocloster hominis]|uniref:aldehyde dehydrogenase family protein n=1 Tax=Diplocloster hominis TaxID=3079010 RepID=UPI0031BB0171